MVSYMDTKYNYIPPAISNPNNPDNKNTDQVVSNYATSIRQEISSMHILLSTTIA